ncbi:MAG: DNA mismatch repair protein MutS [Clostridiales bacterium]|nr:DNA mismatch repair protein MutS [Clostridiales bacterium]
MIEKSMITLEFDKIKKILCNNAVSEEAGLKLAHLTPSLSEGEVKARINETSQARKLLDSLGTPPLASMKDIGMLLDLAQKGAMLVPEQLGQIDMFINACKRMKSYLKRAESLSINLAAYGASIDELSILADEIKQAIRNNQVDDNASAELRDIRRQMERINSEIKSKLDSILRSKKECFTEGYVSIRNGHYVLPVKREYKHMVSGSVLDISSSGSTYFIEPAAVARLKDELAILEIAESNEVRRILYELSALVADNAQPIRTNMEAMVALDFAFAKAKLSVDMKAVPANINTDRRIVIKNGRHPLLKQEECVPLNIQIGDGIRGVIITGPNTGGKTVALKTVGLLQLMAQSGLHIPCESADLCMNNAVLCDIGDGQSITENLSTFSSHITNIINILNHSNNESLVLLDELGSGTDPAEGMGIAIAILEELRKKECLFIVTTHYPEVKEYAAKTEGLINARMAFDRESLKPLYRLEIGEAGQSCALYIAKRLGMPAHILKKAYEEAYFSSHKEASVPDNDFLKDLPVNDKSRNSNPSSPARIQRQIQPRQINTRSERFNIGDCVMVYPEKKLGIVFSKANEKGEVGVQIQKKKTYINHKRLKLKVPADQLYPENYDFSIIFDSVANRKARKKMNQGHQPGLQIVYEDDIKE